MGRGGQRKAPAGHKLCEKCGEASPVRYPNCKECNEPFPMGIRKQKRIKGACGMSCAQLYCKYRQLNALIHVQVL